MHSKRKAAASRSKSTGFESRRRATCPTHNTCWSLALALAVLLVGAFGDAAPDDDELLDEEVDEEVDEEMGEEVDKAAAAGTRWILVTLPPFTPIEVTTMTPGAAAPMPAAVAAAPSPDPGPGGWRGRLKMAGCTGVWRAHASIAARSADPHGNPLRR